MSPPERILVTVKTYPELSKTYGETVCTAGIREDGTWVRLYPVPYRRELLLKGPRVHESLGALIDAAK